MRGPEDPATLAARMTELLGEYEAALDARDRAVVAAGSANSALDAADEALTEAEMRIARHVDEMKASSRLRVRLSQDIGP